MDFNIFDVVVVSITLILAIKGFMNGIIKEVAGLIGIIAGVYFGTLYYSKVGNYINDSIFKIPNESAINAVGFIVTFILVWLFVLLIGLLLTKILKIAQLGLIDRIGGVIFSAGKFFVLVSIILVMLMQVNVFKNYINKYQKNSFTFPIMLKVGETLIHIKPKEMSSNIAKIKNKFTQDVAPVVKNGINKVSKVLQTEVNKTIENSKGE